MASGDPASILVVDDDAPLARSIQILLEDEGRYRVTVASAENPLPDGLDAGRPFNLLIIDLAILDRQLPRLVFDVEDHRGSVPVIVMTAHEAAMDAAHTRSLDVAGFLSKPIDPSTLLAMARDALGDPAPHN